MLLIFIKPHAFMILISKVEQEYFHQLLNYPELIFVNRSFSY